MGGSGSKPAPGGSPIPIPESIPSPEGDTMYIADGTVTVDEDTLNHFRKEEEEAKLAWKNYAKLRSAFLEDYTKHPDKYPNVPAKGTAPSKNLIEMINDEDYDMVDHRQALRIPPMVLKELRDAVEREAQRRCYDAEKTMARCVQDKMWTRWKCQKDRDEYYRCLQGVREDNNILTQLRWKYNLGTFHGEIVARKLIMQRLWMEHFPDREIPHGWANDD